jgi:hypothetical protein
MVQLHLYHSLFVTEIPMEGVEICSKNFEYPNLKQHSGYYTYFFQYPSWPEETRVYSNASVDGDCCCQS